MMRQGEGQVAEQRVLGVDQLGRLAADEHLVGAELAAGTGRRGSARASASPSSDSGSMSGTTDR